MHRAALHACLISTLLGVAAHAQSIGPESDERRDQDRFGPAPGRVRVFIRVDEPADVVAPVAGRSNADGGRALRTVCRTPCTIYLRPGQRTVRLRGASVHVYSWSIPNTGTDVDVHERDPLSSYVDFRVPSTRRAPLTGLQRLRFVRRRAPMLASYGGFTFTWAYGIAIAEARTGFPSSDYTPLYVPIVGPLVTVGIVLSHTSCSGSSSGSLVSIAPAAACLFLTLVAVSDSMLQAGGVAMFAAGLFPIRRRNPFYAPAARVLPTVTEHGAGLEMAGVF